MKLYEIVWSDQQQLFDGKSMKSYEIVWSDQQELFDGKR